MSETIEVVVGSTNNPPYTSRYNGVKVQPDSATCVLTDDAAEPVALSNAPDITETGLIQRIEASELPVESLGKTWQLAITWHYTPPGYPQDERRDVVYLHLVEDITPNHLVTIEQCQTRLRLSGHDQEVSDLITNAQALVEGSEGIGGAIFSTTESEQITVGDRASILKMRNRPVHEVTAIADPYGADYPVGSFLLDAQAGILEAFTMSLGQAYASSLFGAQNVTQRADGPWNAPLLAPGTWTVTYTGGMEYDPRFDRVIRPELTTAVMLTVEALYNTRAGYATAESESGSSHTLDLSSALPPTARRICQKYGA